MFRAAEGAWKVPSNRDENCTRAHALHSCAHTLCVYKTGVAVYMAALLLVTLLLLDYILLFVLRLEACTTTPEKIGFETFLQLVL